MGTSWGLRPDRGPGEWWGQIITWAVPVGPAVRRILRRPGGTAASPIHHSSARWATQWRQHLVTVVTHEDHPRISKFPNPNRATAALIRSILERAPAAGRVFRLATLLVILAGLLTGCARPADPGPAVIRDTPPPWAAPRDAVSDIAAARLPVNRPTTGGPLRTVALHVDVDGFAVAVPAEIGIDRARELQAPAYTRDTTGTITLAGHGAENVTLGQFFTLWGVRFADGCLGVSCGDLYVTTSGERYLGNPTKLRLAEFTEISVSARS